MTPQLAEEVISLVRLIRREIRAVAEHHGLTPTQHTALSYLFDHPKITMSDLTGYLDVTKGAMTGLTDRLEKTGYVRRSFSAEDRRVTYLELTPRGRAVVGSIRQEWQALLASWFQAIPEPERSDVMRSIERLVETGSALFYKD